MSYAKSYFFKICFILELKYVACFQILRSVYDGEARAVPVHIYYPRRSYFMEFLPFCVTLIAQVRERFTVAFKYKDVYLFRNVHCRIKLFLLNRHLLYNYFNFSFISTSRRSIIIWVFHHAF